MSGDVVLGALGMVSSLGHDAASSCAAARAGIKRATALKVLGQSLGKLTLDGPPPTFGHPVKELGSGFSGAGKVLVLGAAALRDLLVQRPIAAPERARTGFALCLSDHALIDAHEALLAAEIGAKRSAPSVAWREKTIGLGEKLLASIELPLPSAGCRVLAEGSPGFARALGEAALEIERGSLDRAIVGAVDSRIEPRFLLAAVGLGALRTNDQAAGLTGGEAAAFVLLERGRDLRARGRKALATLGGVGLAKEAQGDFGDAPATGRALAEAILSAISKSPRLASSLSLFSCDLNGTERRAYEWGLTLTRLRAAGAGDGIAAWIPAASFGDTGAASGAVALTLLTRAFVRGYAPGRGALAWMRSESGAAAAIGVEEAT